MHIVSAELDQCLYRNRKIRHAQADGNTDAKACQEDGCTADDNAAFSRNGNSGIQDDVCSNDDKCIQDDGTADRCSQQHAAYGEAQADGNCRAYETAYGDSRAFR